MKFTVSVLYSVSGWIEIDAENIQEAETKAKELNEVGIDLQDIQDIDVQTEVFSDSIEYMNAEDDPDNVEE